MEKKIKKTQKKRFIEVSVPLTAAKVNLYAYSPEELEGKIVRIDLTKAMRGKNMELKARLVMKNNELTGDLLSLQILPSYMKKVTYKGTDYVEDSFETQCKDAKLRIKPFMITRKRVSRSLRRAIRDAARKHLEAKAKTRTKEELFSEIMANKMQKELSLKIKKLYPLALCEIRYILVEK